jgi:sugar lactone lactonase YvrE
MNSRTIVKNRTASILILLLMVISSLSAQEVSLEASQALDEWRWGVISYNDGYPGKALLALERAVTLNPTNPDIREWLGKSYWRSGIEDAALEVWDRLADEGLASTSLQNRAEQLRRRLSGEEEIPIDDEWIPLVAFHGFEDNIRYFERPAVARSSGDGDGSLLVASYAGGEVVRLDANGTLVERYEGGLEGFDRPFDVLPTPDGRLLVSEFESDRISVLSMAGYDRGYRIETWGTTGRLQGQFLGPQFMASSPDGNFVYISDWGNRRVAKWGLDGTHVLNLEIGGRFQGFDGPSGIACDGERVYVADSLRATIDVFDPSGNYLGPLIEEGLTAPEGLSILNGYLLVADGSEILHINLLSGELGLEATLGPGNHRITSVFPDDNGNLAISDFDSDRIVLLTPLSTLYGGLDITLDRVRADAFPELFVDITVRDRQGHPISGLDASNFRIYDGELSLGQPLLDWSSSEVPESSDHVTVSVVAVTDLSGSGGDVQSLLRGADDLAGALKPGDSLSLVGAGLNAVVQDVAPENGSEILSALIGSSVGDKPVLWDESLRLAATRIVPERRRKAVVAFVNRPPSSTAFDRYGLVETARLMANNGIAFYPVYSDIGIQSRELDYIAEQTGGESSYLYRPEGSGIIVDMIRKAGIGRYTVSWQTPRSSGYGREFLPVSVEVIYINKSGRDESGTFAPLQ